MYLRVEGIVIERSTGRWALIDYDLSKKVDQERFVTANVFRVGRIPFRNIVECDEEGDEYYPGPHLYCKYAENGEPYESMIFKLTDEAAKLANLWPGYTLEAGQQQPSVMKKLPKGMRKPEALESA